MDDGASNKPFLSVGLPKAKLRPNARLHVHLIVSDMKRSIEFYVRMLGFFYDHGLPETAWLTHNNTLLTISPGEPSDALSSYFGWVMESEEELTEAYDKLARAGNRLSEEPNSEEGRFWFFLYDPDEYPIIFSLQGFDHPQIFPYSKAEGAQVQPDSASRKNGEAAD